MIILLLASGCGGLGDPPPAGGAPPPSGPGFAAQPTYPDPQAAPSDGFAAPELSTAAANPAPAYDNVGYAVRSAAGDGIAAGHATLAIGTFAEVTALDSGKTIVVPITAVARAGREIELSDAAAQELGLSRGGPAPVRVRAVSPTIADLTALRAGSQAPARADAPPVLLNALRRKLSGKPSPVTPDFDAGAPPDRQAIARPSLPARVAPPTVQPRAGPGFYVQIIALSDPERAQSVARSVGGKVSSSGRLHRVRLGPFADQRHAQAARDAVAGRGYGDARIVRE